MLAQLDELPTCLPSPLLLLAFQKIESATTPNFGTSVCKRLKGAVDQPEIASAVLASWEAFLEHGEAGISVLASAAAICLPIGVLPGSASKSKASLTFTAPPEALAKHVQAAAKAALQSTKAPSYELSRLIAVAIYRSREVYDTFTQSKLLQAPFAQVAPALQAWLDVVAITSGQTQVDQATIDAGIEAFFSRDDQQHSLPQSAGEIVLLMHRVCPDQALTINRIIEQKLSAATNPAIFDKLSLETRARLSKQSGTLDTFALLESLVNESMKWLVRRFAEDSENILQVSEYITALSKHGTFPKLSDFQAERIQQLPS